MKSNKFMQLLGITEIEQPIARKAIKSKFKALNASLVGLGADWERQRGEAARVTAAVLRLDSESLLQRLSSEPGATELYQSTASWLKKESATLRKLAKRVELASNRLAAVVARDTAERQTKAVPTPPQFAPSGSEVRDA